MPKIEVCLTPELLHQHQLEGKIAVVIDILRATSCMVTGFAHSIEKIRPLADLEQCRALKENGYITAGERNGEKASGFDMGNSPFEYMKASEKGKKIAVTTTNGTYALSKSKTAEEVLVGAFLNLEAIESYLKKKNKDIILVCAGWKGRFNWEDTAFAGAVCHHLKEFFELADDAAVASEMLYFQAKNNLLTHMFKTAHAKRLNGLNVRQDIEFCTEISKYNVLPVLRGAELEILQD